jgi:membrane glycosyltransferase
MGFLQLLIGRDKYSISASTVGDEPLNPAPHGADYADLQRRR